MGPLTRTVCRLALFAKPYARCNGILPCLHQHQLSGNPNAAVRSQYAATV